MFLKEFFSSTFWLSRRVSILSQQLLIHLLFFSIWWLLHSDPGMPRYLLCEGCVVAKEPHTVCALQAGMASQLGLYLWKWADFWWAFSEAGIDLCIQRMSLVVDKTQRHVWFNDANLKKKKECVLRELISDSYVDYCSQWPSFRLICHLDSVMCKYIHRLFHAMEASQALAIPSFPACSPCLIM